MDAFEIVFWCLAIAFAVAFAMGVEAASTYDEDGDMDDD